MSDSSPSVVEIIKSCRWRRAVFTSFTLSLTYFECYILPQLRAQGCATIDIYVDALGYRDSLVEQRSRHAGRDYIVHPVQISNGIFHPKLIYLWSEEGDEDMLMVGSGNLTYAGHGGSLEVFEVLRPMLHSRAYAQAAAFFGGLADGSLDRIDIGDSGSPLHELQRRMDVLAEKHSNVQDVQFLHSLSESGAKQLVRELNGQTFDEFLVMSPYHHPAAEPIKQLVDATRPDAVLVVLDASATTSPFPFQIAAGWRCSVHAVVAQQTKRRFAHAKWYEWRRAGGAVTFTGSFNATAESLTTCNNVECGVLRRNTLPSTEWTEVEPLPFEGQSFPRRGGGVGEWLVTASLSARTLSGRIIAYPISGPKEWSFTLDGNELVSTQPQPLSVEKDGTFSIRLAQHIDTSVENALQIRMVAGSHTARGWVDLPQILSIGAHGRTALSLLTDVALGSESATSFAELLAIVMDEVRSFTSVATASSLGQWIGSKSGKAAAEPLSGVASGPIAMPREIVSDGPAYFGGSPHERLMASLAGGETGWAVWGHLAHALLGPSVSNPSLPAGSVSTPTKGTQTKHSFVHPITQQDPEDDADSEALKIEQDALLTALTGFDSLVAGCRTELKQRVERDAEDKAEQALLSLAYLERTWLHVTLRAVVGPLNDVPNAVYRLGEWLHTTVDTAFEGASRELMLLEYAGCAAVLSYQNAAQPDGLISSLAQLRAPTKSMRAVQYLEAAVGGEPDIELILDLASNWLNSQVGHVLVQGQVEKAISTLRVALSRPTPRELVARFLKEKPTRPDPNEWRPLNENMLNLLHLATRPGRSFGRVDVRAITSCVLCNRDLRVATPSRDDRRPDPTLLAQLKLFCIAECPSCHAPLINDIALSK